MFAHYKSEILTIGLIVFVVIVGAVFAFQTQVRDTKEQSAVAQALFTSESAQYTDLAGNVVSLEEYYGSVLVVNSWAAWCPFCVKELPDFEVLAQEYKDAGVVVMAINRKETKEQAQRFLRQTGTYNNVLFLLDPTDHFYQSIGGYAMPETVFYGRDGNILMHKRGFMTLDEMRVHVEAAITASH